MNARPLLSVICLALLHGRVADSWHCDVGVNDVMPSHLANSVQFKDWLTTSLNAKHRSDWATAAYHTEDCGHQPCASAYVLYGGVKVDVTSYCARRQPSHVHGCTKLDPPLRINGTIYSLTVCTCEGDLCNRRRGKRLIGSRTTEATDTTETTEDGECVCPTSPSPAPASTSPAICTVVLVTDILVVLLFFMGIALTYGICRRQRRAKETSSATELSDTSAMSKLSQGDSSEYDNHRTPSPYHEQIVPKEFFKDYMPGSKDDDDSVHTADVHLTDVTLAVTGMTKKTDVE